MGSVVAADIVGPPGVTGPVGREAFPAVARPSAPAPASVLPPGVPRRRAECDTNLPPRFPPAPGAGAGWATGGEDDAARQPAADSAAARGAGGAGTRGCGTRSGSAPPPARPRTPRGGPGPPAPRRARSRPRPRPGRPPGGAGP